MKKSSGDLTAEEVSANIEANRRAYWDEIAPDLAVFRDTEEERAIRAAEQKMEAAQVSEGIPELHLWAERIAREGREGLRFERWCEQRGIVHSPYLIRVPLRRS